MKRPTIADIAKRAGVSIGAVSYALSGQPGVSDATRARIVAIANEIGWQPNMAARSLSVSRAHAVGLVLARPAPILGIEPFFMRFIAGLEAEFSAHSIALLLQVVEDHEQAVGAFRRWWAERRIDGVIVTDLFVDDIRVPVLEELRMPAVVVGGPGHTGSLPYVWGDDAAAMTAVVEYLVALGHRRIARVAGLPALLHTVVRTEAFRAATETHSVADTPVVVTDYSGEEGARATRTLLARRERPTAIVFDNDVMAVAALGVAAEMGIRVPDELSIVAGDDSPLASLVHPSLTALVRDVSEYGALAARALLDVLNGKKVTSVQHATPYLLPRGSTARAQSTA